MNEEVKVDFSIEREMKISKAMEATGKTRDEVIASCLSAFLKSLGF